MNDLYVKAILTFFTMFYMILVPYICLLAGIDNEVCGAWIGGSVDETGKVVASVSILDNDDATDTAVLIKVSQNVMIAFVCLTLAVVYHDMVQYEKAHKKQLLEKKQKKRYETMTEETDDRKDDADNDDNDDAVDVRPPDMNVLFCGKSFQNLSLDIWDYRLLSLH